MDKELLIVRCSINLKPQQFDNLKDYIELQRTTGSILLPSYCEAVVVPKDVEIKIEDSAKKSKQYNPVEKAYHLLLGLQNDSRLDVSKASTMMEEAIGYLGEALE